MHTVSNKTLLNEAASIVAHRENVSVDFVFAHYTVEQIFGWCKVYNDQHQEKMETIRQWW